MMWVIFKKFLLVFVWTRDMVETQDARKKLRRKSRDLNHDCRYRDISEFGMCFGYELTGFAARTVGDNDEREIGDTFRFLTKEMKS